MQEYIPDSKRRELQREFADLKQGSRIVEQYKKEFDRYLPFVGSQVRDEQAKADKFLWGLNPGIYLAVNQFKPATYREAVDRAIDQEKAMARVKTPEQQKARPPFTKRKFDRGYGPIAPTPHKSETSKIPRKLGASQTEGQASTAQHTRSAQLVCPNCGKVGHTRDQCRAITGACFRCDKHAHRIANCP
ncbi:hypothetical protein SLA2020_017300 [Shorea laevis]